jgi:hypothetical protein
MSTAHPSPGSPHPAPSNAPFPAPPAAKRRRAFLYASFAAVGVLLALGIAILAGARYGLTAFASPTPVTLRVSPLSTTGEEQLSLKLDAFSDRYEQGQDATLELSAPELNAVLSNYTTLGARIAINMTGGRLRAQVSLPLQSIVGDQGRDRWLNGEATLAANTQGGQVQLRVIALTVNGRSAPHRLLDALSRVNLAAEAATQMNTADYVRRVEHIVVEGEKLVIRFKAG